MAFAGWHFPDLSGEAFPEEPTFIPAYRGQLTEVAADGSYLAEDGGSIVMRFVGRPGEAGMPDIPIPSNGAALCRLNNADILRLRLRVPCRERSSPWEPYPADWPKRPLGAGG
jgi:hypothetical protein